MSRELPTDDLAEAMEIYFRYKQVSPKHEKNVRSRMGRFLRWAGGSVSLAELTADTINEYLVHLQKQDLQPATLKGYRASVVTVLRFIKWKPEEWPYIRAVRVPRKKSDGWQKSEIERLLGVAAQLGGYYLNGVRKSDFWIASILAGFSTGLRWGDMAQLPVRDIQPDGRCRVVQHKTGHVVDVKFSPDALAYIRRHGKSVVIPSPHSQKWFCEEFQRLVACAEVRTGSFKWLRRSAGSYAEAEKHGAGRLLLGHTNDVTFDKHYRVDEIVSPKPIELPTLRLNENPVMAAVRAFGRKLNPWRGTAG